MAKITTLILILSALILAQGCATKVPERKDFLFIPVQLAVFGEAKTDEITFDPATNKFDNVPQSATVAFYTNGTGEKFKKASCNKVFFLTTRKEEITRYDPNLEGLMVMKTGFVEGAAYWVNMLLSYSEHSYPNKYYRDIFFDLAESTGDYLETSFAIMAVNTGNHPVTTLFIADVMPSYMELNGPIQYATEDDFMPLNVKLAKVDGVDHKVIEKDNLRIVVYEVHTGAGGLPPGHGVEIKVPVRLLKSKVLKEENKIKE
jgi:hypothetical protein